MKKLFLAIAILSASIAPSSHCAAVSSSRNVGRQQMIDKIDKRIELLRDAAAELDLKAVAFDSKGLAGEAIQARAQAKANRDEASSLEDQLNQALSAK